MINTTRQDQPTNNLGLLGPNNLPTTRITVIYHSINEETGEAYQGSPIIIHPRWTDREDKLLVDFILKHGTDWSRLRRLFPSRSIDDIREHTHSVGKNLKNYLFIGNSRYRRPVFDVKKNANEFRKKHQEEIYNTIFQKKCVISHGKYVFDNRKKKLHYSKKSQNQAVRHPPKSNFLGKVFFNILGIDPLFYELICRKNIAINNDS
jgi:hypothetical protein